MVYASIGKQLHDLPASGERRHRESRPESLSEYRQIGRHVIEFLSASERHPEARDYLVEYQDNVVRFGHTTQVLKIVVLRQNPTRIKHHGLRDNRGNL